ncbi:MAG TPA: FtsX-like permease family protein, partial [Candidatus Elarobacter sp.]|nr:FtsX-like permease family protein [Candidatus Elarobacter sp.]
WRATRGVTPNRPAAATTRRAIGAALPPALDVGFRLAVDPGRGRSAVPVRSALVGAIAGVLGVVGCLTFRAGLDAAVASPQRSGVVWNYVVASGEGPVAPADLATIARDPGVGTAVDAIWDRAVPVNGVGTPTFATRALKETLPFVVLSGRAPAGTGEIAFAPITMKRLHVHVGNEVTVGRATHVRVVGQVLLPATSHTDYDQSGWMTAAGMRAALGPTGAAGADDAEEYVLVQWKPGTDVAAAERRLAAVGPPQTYVAERSTRPTSVVDLGRLRTLPFVLAIFFGLLASATVAHALVTTVRRRRRALAVLRSLGFTRGQARIAIAWQATLLALGGAVVGVPLGMLVGQRSWRVLATNFPLAYAPPVALIAVVLAIPLALALANLLAAGPAHAATRISPAGALRAE